MQWLYTSFEPRLSGFLSNSIGEKYSLKLQDKIQKPTLVIYYSTKYVGGGECGSWFRNETRMVFWKRGSWFNVHEEVKKKNVSI